MGLLNYKNYKDINTIMKKSFLSFILFFVISTLYAAKVDTIYVNSPSMNKKIQVVVITPAIDN